MTVQKKFQQKNCHRCMPNQYSIQLAINMSNYCLSSSPNPLKYLFFFYFLVLAQPKCRTLHRRINCKLMELQVLSPFNTISIDHGDIVNIVTRSITSFMIRCTFSRPFSSRNGQLNDQKQVSNSEKH